MQFILWTSNTSVILWVRRLNGALNFSILLVQQILNIGVISLLSLGPINKVLVFGIGDIHILNNRRRNGGCCICTVGAYLFGEVTDVLVEKLNIDKDFVISLAIRLSIYFLLQNCDIFLGFAYLPINGVNFGRGEHSAVPGFLFQWQDELASHNTHCLPFSTYSIL